MLSKAVHGPTVTGLAKLDKQSIHAFIQQLCRQGFCCLTVDDERLRMGLDTAMNEAHQLTSFRFPPIDVDEIRYTESKRLAFETLFEIASASLGALLAASNNPANVATKQRLLSALERSKKTPLFSKNPHEPFEPEQAFSQSFFNLFNYNHGLLNPHVDRSLMTVIYSVIPPPPEPVSLQQQQQRGGGKRTALWIQDAVGNWNNGDEAASAAARLNHEQHQVLVMVGEDLEAKENVNGSWLSLAQEFNLFAARHAVKVDPLGPDLAHAHFRPDPSSDPCGNRLSAALILRHDSSPSVY